MGVVTVHVYDGDCQSPANATQPARHSYHCDVKLLLHHMRYFAPYLQDLPGQDLEISVRCNLQTFDWLMAYVKSGITGVQPVMDCSNCIPILVACSFLKMAQLSREAVAFIADNILELAAAGVDIGCLDGSLITKIAKGTSEESLEALLQNCQHVQQLPHLQDQKNSTAASITAAREANSSSSSSTGRALLEKLYKHKLEALLQEQQTTLLRCAMCMQLFSASSHGKLQCPTLAGAATERLKVLPQHQPDPTWQFQEFLQQQRRPQQQHQQQQQQHPLTPKPWRDLYWLTWGHVTVLYCQQCHQHFPAWQYGHCSYHPLAAVFASESAAGMYPCCGRPAWQPGVQLADSQGCRATEHQAAVQLQQHGRPQQQIVDTGQSSGAARALQLLQQFSSVITVPYTPPPAPPGPCCRLVNAKAGNTTAAAGSNGSSGSRDLSGRDSSRPVNRGSSSLPLLVRMTRNAASAAPAECIAADAPAAAAAAEAQLPQSGGATANSSCSSSRSLKAADALSSAGKQEHGDAADFATGSEDEYESEDGDDNELAGDLDYRSAHLRSFLDAVRAAGQARNRGSSVALGAGGGGLSAARLAAAEVGVPLGATFSAGGTARPFGWQPPLRPSSSQQGLPSSSRPNSRQNHQQLLPHGKSMLLPSKPPVAASSRPAGWPFGSSTNSHGAANSTCSSRAGSAAAAAAADVQVSRVNRTLLLELMHEDDMYRMGLLMRKLDAVRLQPPPDGRNSSLHPLSEEDTTRACNSAIYAGVAPAVTDARRIETNRARMAKRR